MGKLATWLVPTVFGSLMNITGAALATCGGQPVPDAAESRGLEHEILSRAHVLLVALSVRGRRLPPTTTGGGAGAIRRAGACNAVRQHALWHAPPKCCC